MYIYLLKNTKGYITGFQSHIKHPEKWGKDNLREIPKSDYLVLLYFLTGRDHVKETKNFGTGIKSIGGIYLKDEGDFIEKHLVNTKKLIN